MRASAWWEDVDRRMGGPDITFEGHIREDVAVPAGLFDSFMENMVDNARAKARREPGLAIRVRFECAPSHMELSVADDGSPIPEPAAQRLFREPIERGAGLGIGLYHVGRLANQAGFRIAVACNRAGEVRFLLAQRDERDVSVPRKG